MLVKQVEHCKLPHKYTFLRCKVHQNKCKYDLISQLDSLKYPISSLSSCDRRKTFKNKFPASLDSSVRSLGILIELINPKRFLESKPIYYF